MSGWFLLVWSLCSWLPLSICAKQPGGHEIFRQHCAKCHGSKGEGVAGKFDGPLQGDRPLEKLAQYIQKNMPDDDPGKLGTESSAAVAQYIYNAFYSREARLRQHPVRVELSRLTNRQYLNSVADLLKEFTGPDRGLSETQGLKAVYYASRDFAGDKKSIERIDRVVDFDYGNGSPDEMLRGTNGFSMQWRGSLRTEETGEYEFILVTPNGTRLWVNDDEEPLIDAWVASAKVNEYKATIRLIGGRSYPLMLDYFKYKEKSAGISLQWKPPHGARQPIPGRNLSPERSTPTFVVAAAFPADDSSHGYERGSAVSKAWDEGTSLAAIEVANFVAQHLDRLTGSSAKDTNRIAKIQLFCSEFVGRAFRRPLTDKERRIFVNGPLQNAALLGTKTASRELSGKSKQKNAIPTPNPPDAKSPVEDAVKRIVLRTLKSPRFLYLGLSYENSVEDGGRAERLSYALWDSVPDTELRQVAAAGSLHTREQVREQALRMLKDPRAHAKVLGFFHHWLQMDRVETFSKEDKLFPGFSPELVADLRTSLNLFLENTMWEEQRPDPAQGGTNFSSVATADYRVLLRADFLFLNNRLAEFYGLGTNGSDTFAKIVVKPQPRSGVLTHPYLLAAFAYPKLTSPIHRGVFLTRNIVGRALKPPPMAMTFKDADFAPNLTMREKVAQLTRPQSCQACHSVINPLGFSLEQFDAVGRFRSSDNDRPVDPVSDYLADDGRLVQFSGARDIAEFAIGSPQAHEAFIQQMFQHAFKQSLFAYGPGALEHLRKSFVASDFNMQRLLVDMVIFGVMYDVAPPPVSRETSTSQH